ncbi:hypothetical protein N7468_009205 [Penicillium chermesinum]|uniref:Uncharacterized protein n=1 Tax=Penicillium chermesinum TaxID=63820 RepID=A0A9W9NHN9_9EURO|nr:uncharacterized protein N7468_009205 [Penicillium chermesinum]KAJ5220001.1 hypothetical protein N7468_009205 [Penicillium chermesinum]KAJ6157458.1 hypothetical protein N7470_005050 [Penicillium chermesinum]
MPEAMIDKTTTIVLTRPMIMVLNWKQQLPQFGRAEYDASVSNKEVYQPYICLLIAGLEALASVDKGYNDAILRN